MDGFVFLAALAAGPIAFFVWLIGYRMHRIELQTGRPPRWGDLFIFGVPAVGFLIYWLAGDSPFFFNLMSILGGLFLSLGTTYYVSKGLVDLFGRSPEGPQQAPPERQDH